MALSPIYRGLGFPFKVGDQTFPKEVTDDELIRDALIQLILTNKGERVMRYNLGTSAYAFVFESNDTILAAAIRSAVANAINQFEPRVTLRGVDVTKESTLPDGKDDQILITVRYVVPATQQQGEVSVVMGMSQAPL